MMGTKIAAALALLLALSGWGLYRQISANGSLQKQIEQREQQLSDAANRISELDADIKARDDASRRLQADYEALNATKSKVQTVVRKVYSQPDTKPWAETIPPAAVVDAVNAGIGELWRSDGSIKMPDTAVEYHR